MLFEEIDELVEEFEDKIDNYNGDIRVQDNIDIAVQEIKDVGISYLVRVGVAFAKTLEMYLDNEYFLDALKVLKSMEGADHLVYCSLALRKYCNTPVNKVIIDGIDRWSQNWGPNKGDILAEEKVQDLFNSYKDFKHLDLIFDQIMALDTTLDIKPITQILQNKKIKDYLHNFGNPGLIGLIFDGFGMDKAKEMIGYLDKYSEHDDLIINAINNYGAQYATIRTLREEVVYNAINKSRNPRKLINLVIKGDYGRTIKGIEERQVYENIDLEDACLIKQTLEVIKTVHKNRQKYQIERIENGFYDGLNRAIYQADNYKGKIKNIRQYCREVQLRIKDEAADLMVVTNV